MKTIQSALVAILVLLAGFSAPAHADIEEIMSDTFGSMVNVTDPAAYAGARRGVLTGGSIIVHNKRVRPILVAFKAPRIKAGCGGFSIFGGAFSAINMDEMVEYMRSIMSNALSYLFQLGITAICPSCSNVLSNLEALASKANNLLKDSCEMGKMVAEFVAPDADTFKNNAFQQAAASAESWTDGAVQAMADGKTPFERAYGNNADEASKAFEQNIVLEAIMKTQVLDNYLGPGADATAKLLMAQQIISLIGTVTLAKDPSGGTELTSTPWPATLTVKHLLWGKLNVGDDKSVVYKCLPYDSGRVAVERCLTMEKTDKDVIGFAERIGYLLIGEYSGTPRTGASMGMSSDTKGIYQKIVNDEELSNQEKSILAVTPVPVFPILREYGLAGGPGGGSSGAAKNVSRIMADMIAADVLSEILTEILNEVQRGVIAQKFQTGDKNLEAMIDNVKDARAQIDHELKEHKNGRIKNIADLAVHFEQVRNSMHGVYDPNIFSGRSIGGG